jgi:glycosyltransferase involved in cell wall biosynthesis
MRFVQVFNRYLQPGGEETSVGRIAAHLEKGGHVVERFWRASEEWSGPDAPPRWRRPLLLFNNPAVLEDLRRCHLQHRPDAWILHNILPVVSMDVYRLARTLNVPVIQWLHNYRPISPGGTLEVRGRALDPADPWILLKETLAGTWRGRMTTALVAASYLRARWRGDFASVAAWVAVGDEMRQIVLRAGWSPDRTFTVRHAWDVQPWVETTTPGSYFLFLGRLIDLKGIRFLVDLWEDPELRDLPLVLAGGGPLKDELSGRCSPAIRWPGYVTGDDKRRLVSDARAIVFPCLWAEPLSTVAYEAYERGRPLLASDLGGLRETVFDGRTGRLLPPGDRAAWKQAILDAWRRPDETLAWGRAGRQWLEEFVSAAAWNRAFNKVLDRVFPDRTPEMGEPRRDSLSRCETG